MRALLAAVALAGAGTFLTGGTAYANHCDPSQPPVAYRLCGSVYSRCYYEPETGRIWCEPGH